MKCPYCSHAIHFEPYYEGDSEFFCCPTGNEADGLCVVSGFCSRCDKLIVVLQHGIYDESGPSLSKVTQEEVIYPRFIAREPLPEEVPGEFRSEFEESAAVLSASPKASAAISRRLLQRTLREKLGIPPSTLAKEIDALLEKSGIPGHITSAVDAIRNIGNYAAHPEKDKNTGAIVDVEPGEAEWLLDTLEDLFDFVFVQPAKLEERKRALNEKLSTMGKPPMKEKK